MVSIENNITNTLNLVDIDKVIYSKNPRLYSLLPNFIINYLKKIIHQDWLNEIIIRNRDIYGIDFINALIKQFDTKIKIKGEKNLRSDGRYILAGNHPLGGLDGIALMYIAGKKFPDLKFPVNDLLMYLSNLSPLFIPINKHGSNINHTHIIEKTFSSDDLILYFPAGICSRKIKGEIIDLPWKKTFITKARQYKRDIIPVFIEGKNSNFFYNLSNIRKKLGIKANIEMIYLVDEVYKQQNKEIILTFGHSIPFQLFDKRFTDIIWAAKVKDYVYLLSSDPDIPFSF